MKKLNYKVEFLSDIVLLATSNTEGNIAQLDFIPGSNFLGIAASRYKDFENSFDVFHSGKVRFGDATISKEGKRTYKVPLSYFHKKADDKKIYNHHLIEDFKTLGQLKQLRSGYITQDNELLHVEYTYSQKSAYDKDRRRSKDSQMYGYSAIRQGTSWVFSISYDESISRSDLELLDSTITGDKRLGKSKSAEYGLVKITKTEEIESPKREKCDETILYANSRLALVDKRGDATYELKNLCEGLRDEDIVYEKTQIKTSTFTPYNGARQTKDYERCCINKGSVVVLKGINDTQLKQILGGVGAYLSEGFGEILVNPSFLMKNEFELVKNDKKDKKRDPIAITTDLAKFLKSKEDKKQDRLNILDSVDEFIDKNKKLYKNIKPSQWGKIRSICTSGQNDFKKEIKKYISNGTKKWEKRQIDTLLQNNFSLEFVKLISIQMPKKGA